MPDIMWDFEDKGEGEYGEPKENVNLIVNGKKYHIKSSYYKFSKIVKDDYRTFDIPKDALLACRGWWAGAGEDFWVIKKDNALIVYHREIGEPESDSEPYIGKQVKVNTIKLE